MRRIVLTALSAVVLFLSCEKLPPPDRFLLNAKFYDLQGKPLLELYEGLEIKLVSDKFKQFSQQGIDLQKEGVILFDKMEAPIDKVGDDFIITRVPTMAMVQPVVLNLTLRVRDQFLFQVCAVCLPYLPTVRGRILTGFTGGAPDGNFLKPAEMTLDASGNIYVIDQRATNDIVLRVTPLGEVSTFAGSSAEFGRLVGIGINTAMNKMYLADATAQRVLELNMASPGAITTLAGSGVAGNTNGTGTAASFNFGNQAVDNFGSSETGQGLALDAAGNIYVAENVIAPMPFYSQIRKITPAGVVTTVPGSRIEPTSQAEAGMPSGLVLSPANDIWYVSGSSGFYQGVTRVNADGSRTRPAGRTSFEGLNDGTGNIAQFSFPKAIATNGTNFYVADGTNGALRRVSAAGEVITLAGVGHFNTNRFRGGGFLPPLEGSWRMPSPFLLFLSEDFYERAAASIRMDQVGGVAVTNGGRLIYVSDYGYQCIWVITIR